MECHYVHKHHKKIKPIEMFPVSISSFGQNANVGLFFFVEFFMSNLASANTFKVLALALLLA